MPSYNLQEGVDIHVQRCAECFYCFCSENAPRVKTYPDVPQREENGRLPRFCLRWIKCAQCVFLSTIFFSMETVLNQCFVLDLVTYTGMGRGGTSKIHTAPKLPTIVNFHFSIELF